ncbi:MAG TPA: AroM family protein, partial [Firmicutes bacterium]|nr:AroM family protein [Candidatus Fermentithermobacillaceae bacterium]HHX11047.1 AroM family protein [Bacillota bacterium]
TLADKQAVKDKLGVPVVLARSIVARIIAELL